MEENGTGTGSVCEIQQIAVDESVSSSFEKRESLQEFAFAPVAPWTVRTGIGVGE